MNLYERYLNNITGQGISNSDTPAGKPERYGRKEADQFTFVAKVALKK